MASVLKKKKNSFVKKNLVFHVEMTFGTCIFVGISSSLFFFSFRYGDEDYYGDSSSDSTVGRRRNTRHREDGKEESFDFIARDYFNGKSSNDS